MAYHGSEFQNSQMGKVEFRAWHHLTMVNVKSFMVWWGQMANLADQLGRNFRDLGLSISQKFCHGTTNDSFFNLFLVFFLTSFLLWMWITST